jgi:adenylate kinase
VLLKRIEKRIADMSARGEQLRSDDNPEVLEWRLKAYKDQTAPLTTFYAMKRQLRTVDGMAPIPEVAAAIDGILAGESDAPKTRAAAAGAAVQGKRVHSDAAGKVKAASKAKSSAKRAKSKPAKPSAKKASARRAAKTPAKNPSGKARKTGAKRKSARR